MPMSYDVSFVIGATQTTAVRLQGQMLATTTAGKPSAYITACWAGCGGSGMTTAGGGYVVGSNWQTSGTTTTTVTPNKKNQYQAASAMGSVTNVNGNGAIGTGTQTARIYVNYAQTGGPGFWMAANPDMACMVQNNGGTTAGYLDWTGASASTSENLEGSWEWAEM